MRNYLNLFFLFDVRIEFCFIVKKAKLLIYIFRLFTFWTVGLFIVYLKLLHQPVDLCFKLWTMFFKGFHLVVFTQRNGYRLTAFYLIYHMYIIPQNTLKVLCLSHFLNIYENFIPLIFLLYFGWTILKPSINHRYC